MNLWTSAAITCLLMIGGGLSLASTTLDTRDPPSAEAVLAHAIELTDDRTTLVQLKIGNSDAIANGIARLTPDLVRVDIQVLEEPDGTAVGFIIDPRDGRKGIRVACNKWAAGTDVPRCLEASLKANEKVVIVYTR